MIIKLFFRVVKCIPIVILLSEAVILFGIRQLNVGSEAICSMVAVSAILALTQVVIVVEVGKSVMRRIFLLLQISF